IQQSSSSLAAIDEGINELHDSLKSVNVSQLNSNQIAVLEKIGLIELVDQVELDGLKKIVRNNASIAIKQTAVQRLHQAYSGGVTWIKNSYKVLQKIEDNSVEPADESHVLTRLKFHKDASISNIEDLKYWS
ncbi:hypothetical protein R0J89_14565, partial [Psychrobacter sp. SIMBA_152]